VGEFIGIYAGEIEELSEDEPKDYVVHVWPDGMGPPRHYINARYKRNYTGFVNHSYDNDNVELRMAWLQDQWHAFMVATQQIERGKQLLLNYGPGYWMHLGKTPIDF
jgi:hypothetical protein